MPDYISLEKAEEFKRTVTTNFGNIDKLKILSYGFVIYVYMYLDARIHYKYFFIPSISYFIDRKAYDAKKSYLEEEDPYVFIYRGNAINSELPSEELNRLKNLINEKYIVVHTVFTSDEDPKAMPAYIMGRRRNFTIFK
jgi:hypothetical protein